MFVIDDLGGEHQRRFVMGECGMVLLTHLFVVLTCYCFQTDLLKIISQNKSEKFS